MLTGIWRYRGFISGSVRREFQSRYRNSMLGAAWTVLNPLAMIVVTILGLSVAAVQIIATLGGVSILFPCLMLTITFIYFMGGLIFYHAVAANVSFTEIQSDKGHDSFLLELPEFDAMVRGFINGSAALYGTD